MKAAFPTDLPFDSAELKRIVETRRGLILKVAGAVVLLTVLALLALPARYTGSALVMLEPRKNNVTEVSAVLSQLPTDPASVQNQIQILTSRELAGKVVDRFGLVSDPEFGGPEFKAGGPRARDTTIDSFLRNLSVDAVGLSTSFSIRFTSRDPQKAAKLANAVADAYVEGQAEAKFEATAKTTQWLLDRIQRLAKQVQASEEAVQRYKAEHNLNDAPEGGSITHQQMGAISTQLVTARADLAQKQAVAARVAELVRAGRAAEVSQVVASPFIGELRGQEAEVIRQEAELATRYGPKHPKLIEAQNQKKNLEAKIAEEVRRVVETAANDAAIARGQSAALEASLKRIETSAASENLARVKLKSLEANAASTQSMYQAFVGRLRATQDPSSDQLPDARVISKAAVPSAAAGPRKLILIAASIPAGLLLGLLAALLAERAETGGSPRLPVLARLSLSRVRLCEQVIDNPSSGDARAISDLARQLLAQGAGRAVLIAPAEGPPQSDFAVALARAAAQNGQRVVLVDGNFRSPQVAETIGVVTERGLVAALTGRLPLSQCFFRDTRSPALMLACARELSNPAQLLGSPAMAQLIDHLRAGCDLVIVDSAAVLSSSDAAKLARLCDMSLLVSRDTPRKRLAEAAEELSPAARDLAVVELKRAA